MVASVSAVGPKVVLFIADRSPECEELKAALQEEGLATMTVSNAHDAAVAIHVARPAAVLADCNQQGFDGWQILWWLRNHEHSAAHLPLMLLTDQRMTTELRRVLGLSGVRWIFEKPLALSRVSRIVLETVGASAPPARLSERSFSLRAAHAPALQS